MIRINLLPYHEKAKKETQTRQIVIIAGAFIVFLLIVGAVHLWITMSVSGLEKDVKTKEERIVVLNKLIGEVEQIRNEKRILERKLGSFRILKRIAIIRCVFLPMWPLRCRTKTSGWRSSPRKASPWRWKARPGTTSHSSGL